MLEKLQNPNKGRRE